MRIIFADDHALVRQTLKHFLHTIGETGRVEVDEADTLSSLLGYVGTTPEPALVLLDLAMPGMKGTQSIPEIQAAFPAARIVVLSGFTDKATILQSFKAGAAGFIPKSMGRDEFISALRLVLNGQRYVPPTLVDNELIQGLSNLSGGGIADLSERETAMLKMVAEGKKNKEIAHQFALEEVTIKLALSRLYRKLSVSNRAAAVHLAVKAGLV
ncbi:MAG: response regulator [Rhodospirillaceae bacterium]